MGVRLAAGCAWRFDGPWDWHPFDGGKPSTPAWPLRLLDRAGDADAAAGAAVARATSTGSHEAEPARWMERTQARPSRGTPPG
ncbi:hypothetical protein AB0D57_24080 [Streptomyces sp. NPDC048275]|uniref:hypothetical protein n=1 Tax=Streptomyces sp. NPDC048275 TaxID=3155629 RepID=UPI0033CAD4B5